ncbi:carbohydrate ABC transporter permease [Cryptosporangium aurantiacum]|uniref:Carbohydrate ABC transporter membrane protein 1, CUT1 family n=1 Tax=Cryptosporangium aurantiacum TaxID=134849 RepID=A0A1M7JYC8_9ACTN|nr:sugar ABC transporter permease [Cryptosporangium aurantiacum]SHM57955.1 carbohydrate ABC transporter membrane protein 1, CUT1 family [Cryptosporangium aurantiacum]
MTTPQATVATPSTPTERSAPVGKRKKLRRLTGRDRVVLGLMVGIPTLIELLLVWGPALFSVLLGFTDARTDIDQPGGVNFAGLDNYKFITEEYPPFWPAVQHNIIWLLFLAVIATPLGLFIAVLLDQNLRGSRIYQSIFFVPVMLSLALVGIIWHLIYSPDAGLLNSVLGTAGTDDQIDWFGDSSINLWAALVAASWKHVGYIMILYLAGLKGVDPSLREAAQIDGANAVQTFFRVVFPAMRPINIVVVVITVIEALRAFDIVYVINRGTNGLELLSALVVQNLVGEGTQIGVGAAIATVLLVISLVPIVAYLWQTFRKEEQR